jgi:predicted small secreted protein
MKTLSRAIVALAVCAVAAAGALGCNTIRGAGRDIQTGGSAVESAAYNGENEQKNQNQRYHTIMAVSDSGGTIRPAGGTNVPNGSTQTFVIEPHPGNRVEDVFVDGRSVGPVNEHTFDRVTSSHTISALFCADSSV